MSKTVVFHYARPNEDYEGWGLKARVDEADEFVSHDPHHDAFGLVWKVEFEDDVTAFRYRLAYKDTPVTDPDGRNEQVVPLESEDMDLWYPSEFAVEGNARFLNVAPSDGDDILEALRHLRAEVQRLTGAVVQLRTDVDAQRTLTNDLADRLANVEQISIAHTATLQDAQVKATKLAETVDVLVKQSTTPVVKPTHIDPGDLKPLAALARGALEDIAHASSAALDDFTGGVPQADLIAALNRRRSQPLGGDGLVVGDTEELLFAMTSTADRAKQRFSLIFDHPDEWPSLLPVTLEAEIRELGRYYADTVQEISELDETEPDRVRAHERLVERLDAPELDTAINKLRGAGAPGAAPQSSIQQPRSRRGRGHDL
jgi:hypothetical protein